MRPIADPRPFMRVRQAKTADMLILVSSSWFLTDETRDRKGKVSRPRLDGFEWRGKVREKRMPPPSRNRR